MGYDSAGRRVAEASKKTASPPAAVRLTARTRPAGLRADGADVALFDVEVVDAEGNRCPTALDTVSFTLEGPAEWRGGIAQGPDNFTLSRTLPVENGVNRVIIRSTTKAGKVVLRATAEGLKPAAVQLVSRPSTVASGLSTEMPDDSLAPNFERGPTPAGPSFAVSRNAVAIARASAGSNAEKVSASFDDNEVSAWASDGKPEAAWVAYEFERPARVSEVVLKLTGWRTQSYPLRVLLDDRVVFSGDTPRSLGYVTLSFPPSVGRRLRIELTGAASNRDAFGNIVEIPGTSDQQSAAGRGGARGTLGIHEVEVYEPAIAAPCAP